LFYFTSNTTNITEVQSASARLFVGMRRTLLSVITTLVASIFHCQVWYHALSLCYASIRGLGIIFSFVTMMCQISFLSRRPSLTDLYTRATSTMTTTTTSMKRRRSAHAPIPLRSHALPLGRNY